MRVRDRHADIVHAGVVVLVVFVGVELVIIELIGVEGGERIRLVVAPLKAGRVRIRVVVVLGGEAEGVSVVGLFELVDVLGGVDHGDREHWR